MSHVNSSHSQEAMQVDGEKPAQFPVITKTVSAGQWQTGAQVRNVLDAIKAGSSYFEPEVTDEFKSTMAIPGSPEKLDVMAERLRQGLPLWNDHDRRSYNDADAD